MPYFKDAHNFPNAAAESTVQQPLYTLMLVTTILYQLAAYTFL